MRASRGSPPKGSARLPPRPSLRPGSTRCLSVPTAGTWLSDLLAFFFRSSEANDLCYGAAIGRDHCRGLPGSEEAPAPLKADRLMRRVESDVCIIGGGISAALLAQKLRERAPRPRDHRRRGGAKIFDFENRTRYRQRWLEYGENPWPGDFVADQEAQGVISRTMAVGGSALHWGGVTQPLLRGRPAAEVDVRPRRGLAARMERARTLLRRGRAAHLGVSGEPSPCPEDWRSAPYPMPPMPLSYNLKMLKAWAEKSGIPFWRHAAGQEHRGRTTAAASLPALQHLRDLSRRARATRPTSPSSGCSRRRRSRSTTRRSCAGSCSTTRRARVVRGRGG